jgi:hypothetical protein
MIECSKCKIKKDETDFKKDKRRKNNISSWCKKCNADANKEYRKNNSETSHKSSKNWKINNKQKINNYQKNRRDIDFIFKLKMNLRTRLKKAIKNQSGIQAKTTIELLGCTGHEAYVYLESKFDTNMS